MQDIQKIRLDILNVYVVRLTMSLIIFEVEVFRVLGLKKYFFVNVMRLVFGLWVFSMGLIIYGKLIKI